MFALTVDQIDSRHDGDRVPDTIRRLEERHGARLTARPERTAGDEFQLATDDPATALAVALDLVRDEHWSVGLGIGDVRAPRGESVRALTGGAFVAARDAVTAAKRRPTRFALAATDAEETTRLDPLVGLLLALRERRTPEGWELADLLDESPELTLTDAAARLGISTQAASQRAQTARLVLDTQARDALVALLAAADARIGG